MLAIGCDHGGYRLKTAVINYLKDKGIEFRDFGTDSEESVDYAPIAANVGHSIIKGECDRGVLICGTGIGMSLAANKISGIRAAVCSDEYSCEFTRRHNDSNILCMGGRVIDENKAVKLTEIFLNTEFEGGRHQRRIDQIAMIERGEL